MKNKENIKVCLVGSSGGHLTHLYMLKSHFGKTRIIFGLRLIRRMQEACSKVKKCILVIIRKPESKGSY